MPADLRTQLETSLGGTYAIEQELGGGGMSRVFLATDTNLGRRVVLKVLSPELTEGISAKRFTREIRLSASLQHANVVPVHSAGDANGIPYYTMPFIAGHSLRGADSHCSDLADTSTAETRMTRMGRMARWEVTVP